MTTKDQRIEAERQRIASLSRKDLEAELCSTLVGTLMPLIETVVEKRVSQWIEVISDGLRGPA
jgi:hypothetical protein